MNGRLEEREIKFLIYPQPKTVKGFKKPVIIYIDAAPGAIRPGPEDEHIRVIDAKHKDPYKDELTWKPRSTPPYPDASPRYPPVKPRRGHFDYLRPGTRAFSSATVFATVRFVLDVWKHYFARPLPWFFRDTSRPLEVIPRVYSGNSWSGAGYLEFGFPKIPRDGLDYRHPLCENFDAVAHETGHFILKSIMGNPTDDQKTLEYRAYEEASADLVAIVASLHFDSVVDCLHEDTHGRLFSANLLSRLVELPEKKGEIRALRRAFNNKTMSSPSVQKAITHYEKYGLSLPFTGGAFDLLAEIYELKLVERGTIPPTLKKHSFRARLNEIHERKRIELGTTPPAREKRFSRALRQQIAALKREFGHHFENKEEEFKDTLRDATDDFAQLMAQTWDITSVDGFSYWKAVTNMIAADEELNKEKYGDLIRKLFIKARGISPAPLT